MPKVNFSCKFCKHDKLILVETNITKFSEIERIIEFDEGPHVCTSGFKTGAGTIVYSCEKCGLYLPVNNDIELLEWLRNNNMLDWEN